MVKCSICGEQIELRSENRYEVVIEAGVLQKSFGAKDQIYEAFDCPHCGCQMLMQERFPVKNEIKIAEERKDECDNRHIKSDNDVDGTKTDKQNKVVTKSGFFDCKCDAIEPKWKDDAEVPVKGVRDELQSLTYMNDGNNKK